MESSDKLWSTGEGNGKPLQNSCLENTMNHIKRQKDMTLKDELPWSVRVKYTTGGEQRNSSRSNEEAERKRKYSQLRICPVAKAKSNAVNTNIAYKPGMLGP